MVHSDIANDSFSYKFTTASVIIKLFSKKRQNQKSSCLLCWKLVCYLQGWIHSISNENSQPGLFLKCAVCSLFLKVQMLTFFSIKIQKVMNYRRKTTSNRMNPFSVLSLSQAQDSPWPRAPFRPLKYERVSVMRWMWLVKWPWLGILPWS